MRNVIIVIAILIFSSFIPGTVHAQTTTPCSGNTGASGNFSCTLTGAAVMILPNPTSFTISGKPSVRLYERIENVSTSSTIWCSRFTNAPAANAAGSFPLNPFGTAPFYEEFGIAGQFVPQFPLYCSGTGTVTGEAY